MLWRSQQMVNISITAGQLRLIEIAVCSWLVGCWLFQPLQAQEGFIRVSPAVDRSPDSANDVILSAVREGDRFLLETVNFRISSRLGIDETRDFAVRCESLRREFQTRWFGETASMDWTPKADVVIHRSVEEFRAALGVQSTGASGCVTIQQHQGRVTVRRIDLRADVAGWNGSSLSHELTHMILVEYFPGRRIPRWADEGMAVLAEAREKRSERETAALGKTTLPLSQLLCTEAYPSAVERAAFYADSASLTQFLIDRGGRGKFLTFLQQAMNDGYDRALRENYNWNGVCELERAWKSRPASATSRTATLATRSPRARHD